MYKILLQNRNQKARPTGIIKLPSEHVVSVPKKILPLGLLCGVHIYILHNKVKLFYILNSQCMVNTHHSEVDSNYNFRVMD